MSLSAPAARLGSDLRVEFPVLNQLVRGRPLVYLDNAATTQKPRAVIDATSDYYTRDNANVHRGVHSLSQRATDAFDATRSAVRAFVGAAHDHEIIFTKGCTEAVNLVANSWGLQNLKPGDEILLSTMEHHANIVPWQLAAERTGAIVRPIPITDAGEIELDAYRKMLSERVRYVGVVHVSNSLGTINPIQEMARMAHEVGAIFLADGAQALAHEAVDVRALGVDFYTISGHKMYGPTGIGALYGRTELLEAMPPYQAGGDMIRTVSFEGSTFAGLPNKFEPGTPNIAGVVGWSAAFGFLSGLDHEASAAYERELTRFASERLASIPKVSLVGTAANKASIVSFIVDGVHPHDIGTILDQHGVAIRTGHHCCMPLMKRLGLPATARASFAIYNTPEEIESLGQAVEAAIDLLG